MGCSTAARYSPLVSTATSAACRRRYSHARCVAPTTGTLLDVVVRGTTGAPTTTTHLNAVACDTAGGQPPPAVAKLLLYSHWWIGLPVLLGRWFADRYPHGVKYFLQVTKSISMWDDTHVSCLSDLSNLDELEECKLRQCHKTVHVFRNTYNLRENMKNAFVSHLKTLTHFLSSMYPWPFYALKHLVLEHCPRLEGVVPRDCELPRLETLGIHFCYNLKAIFYDNGRQSSSASYKLPCLRRIRLHELPLLEHLHVDNPMLSAPRWKELYVRGCWSLRRLSRFGQQPDKAVVVSGERAWWAKLRWDQDGDVPRHRDSYEPRLPPELASRRERIVIKSYLR